MRQPREPHPDEEHFDLVIGLTSIFLSGVAITAFILLVRSFQ